MKLNFSVSLRSETDYFDIFRETSEEDVSNNSAECWKTCFVISRILFCSLLFMFTLATSIVSKMTFLLMIGNLFPTINEKNLTTSNGTWSHTKSATDVRWIWGILITITAPYLFTIIKYLWMLLVKKTRPMRWKTLLVVYSNKIFFIIPILLLTYILCFLTIFFFSGIYH